MHMSLEQLRAGKQSDEKQVVVMAAGTVTQVQTLTFEQSTGSSTKQLALQSLALDGVDDQAPQEDGDDLLDLLDSVAQS